MEVGDYQSLDYVIRERKEILGEEGFLEIKDQETERREYNENTEDND